MAKEIQLFRVLVLEIVEHVFNFTITVWMAAPVVLMTCFQDWEHTKWC